MDRRSPFRASLLAAALASVAGLASAAVTDNSGTAVQNNTGQCTDNVYGSNCAGSPLPAAPASAPSSAPESSAANAPAPRSDIAALSPESTSPAPRTAGENGYVTDNTGSAVYSVNGNCLTDNTGAVDYGVPECGGVIARVAPPVAAAPAAQPQPREAPLQRITLDTDTTFGFDSAVLTDQGKEQLKNVVDAAKNEHVSGLQIHVTGYTDRIGPDDYNQKLSQERADAVRQYFVDAGLPADVISTEGRGKANPVVQCPGMRGDQLIACLRPNRRSEVEFAALEPAQPSGTQQAPSGQTQNQSQPWEPGTDTGTPQ